MLLVHNVSHVSMVPIAGPAQVTELYAAITTAADSLASNAATLQRLSEATTIADVQSIAEEMKLGSLGYLIRQLAPLATSTTSTDVGFLSDFPRSSDVIQQLANFNNSLLIIPNNPWSGIVGPSIGNYGSLTPVQIYIWYHNTFAMETWTAVTNYIVDPTSQDGLTTLIQACQTLPHSESGFVSDWLLYMTVASDPTGACYNATDYGFQLGFIVCLFNVANGIGDEVNYQDGFYLSYAKAFISDAAFTTEVASACNGVVQNNDLYPFSQAGDITAFNIPYYQANYTVIVNNLVQYAGYLQAVFWNGALLAQVNKSFSNSIGNSQANQNYAGGQNQYLADNLFDRLTSAYNFVFWDVIVFDANPNGAGAVFNSCFNPGSPLPDPSASLCASTGGSFYLADFALANSQSTGFALFFTSPGETPQVAALNETLLNTYEGCQSYSATNGTPLQIVNCIIADLSSTGVSTRGVVAVSFGNALRAQYYPTMLFFANLPINDPDTSFVILPAQSFS